MNSIIKYYLILKGFGTKYLKREWKNNRWNYTYKPVSQRSAHELTKNRFEKVTKINDDTHKNSIEKALQNGEKINVRILKDYPDLIKKYGQEKRIIKANKINQDVINTLETIKQNDNVVDVKNEPQDEEVKTNKIEENKNIVTVNDTFSILYSKNETFKKIADTFIRQETHKENPNIIDGNLKTLSGDAWSRIKNRKLDSLKSNSIDSKDLMEKIYENFSTGSFDKINNELKKVENENKNEQKNMFDLYNNKQIGNVFIRIDGDTAKLKFPFDLIFSDKLKNNYSATFDFDTKEWLIHISELKKLENLINKIEKQKQDIRKKIQEEKDKIQFQNDTLYNEQKIKWKAEKEEYIELKKQQIIKDQKKEKILINVSYSDKDKAKNLGAKWDSVNKEWYIYKNDISENDYGKLQSYGFMEKIKPAIVTEKAKETFRKISNSTFETNVWIDKNNGDRRIYFKNLEGIYGLDVSYYNTGNVSSATLDGNLISNSQAKKILNNLGDIWFDESTNKYNGLGNSDEIFNKIVGKIKENIN